MRKTSRLLFLLAAVTLGGLLACTPERPRDDAPAGEPLPDTFPAPATGADLPEGMLLPPPPEDTAPAPPR